MATYTDVITAIVAGDFTSNQLENIALQAAEAKKQAVRGSLCVGDRVSCTGLRPRYINGQPARVVKVNHETATIRFEGGAVGRFRGDVRCPIGALRHCADQSYTP